MVQLRREAEADAERRYNAVSEPVRRARSNQFSQRMHEVVERRQTPSQLSLPGMKPTLMALRYPGLMTRAEAIANGLVMPIDSASVAASPRVPSVQAEPAGYRARPEEARLTGQAFQGVTLQEAIGDLPAPDGSERLQKILDSMPGGGAALRQSPQPKEARPERVAQGAPPPNKDTILRQLRAMASAPGTDAPPPPPEPARFRATPEEARLAGQMFRGAALQDAIGLPSGGSNNWRYQKILASLPGGGGGGAPPVVPPGGMFPAQAPLPSGRPRTGPVMAGSRFPGILGLGLASLGGIAGAVVQDENHLTPEVATSLALGAGGAGLLAAAALRAPADNYLIRRGR